MAQFANSTIFYSCMEAMFDRVQERDPAAAEKLQESKSLLRFNCSNPDAIIVINGRRNPAVITYDDDRIRPEVDVFLSADTLHNILLGELKITRALRNNRLLVKGSVHKALAVTELFRHCQSVYPQILREQGLDLGQIDSESL